LILLKLIQISDSLRGCFAVSDVQSERMVDKNVQLKFVEQEKPKRDEAGEFLRGPVGPAPAEGGNYDSIHNINPKVAGFITVCFLSFVGYIIFRVWRSMRRDERNRRRF
jgi:hypothetical protein